MNDLVPSMEYEQKLAPIELERRVSLCQLCANVSCKSKKLDTWSLEKPTHHMIIFDQFSTNQLDDDHMEKLHVILDWLQFHPSYAYITSAIKCEGGEVVSCENYLREEIALINPSFVFLFTETYSFLNEAVQFGSIFQLINNAKYIELPHPRLWKTEQDYHYVYNMMLHTFQGGSL